MTNMRVNSASQKASRPHYRAWLLVAFDILCCLLVDLFILVIYPSSVKRLDATGKLIQIVMSMVSILVCRFAGGVYRQVWRYADTKAYLHLIVMDFLAGCLYCFLSRVFLPWELQVTFVREVSIIALTLLLSLGIRFIYQYLRESMTRHASSKNRYLHVLTDLLGISISEPIKQDNKTGIIIVGAGRVGAMLAEELTKNPRSQYRPYCFIDIDQGKIGREIQGVKVISEEDATAKAISGMPVQEIVFALPQLDTEEKKRLYNIYKETGLKIKVYDYPLAQAAEGSKRQLREFGIEELLFRKAVDFVDEKTMTFYRGKTVLITGGGGSIGSELCRQIARMQPKQMIVVDVYENNAYDIQQELKIAYGGALNLFVEIMTVCDAVQLDRIFAKYRPDIVLHAAAHKHVPLMEHNCVEAVKNNVFGTLNMVNVSEKYEVGKFIMISTDKAVNPTNVMGATKRMCEMIVLSRNGGHTTFCATRFGNVLGSNGSVIPLFKRQISNGGPITLTDKRIIRYFMTIPEASQLVLQSGAMAQSGELYALDMGKPVKILELAENMIRLSGFEPYKDIDIIETGLRPGEKLYEELLIRDEELDKTGNSMIFIERDKPISREEANWKLNVLRQAVQADDEEQVKEALRDVVPTFLDPSTVNASAQKAPEMKLASGRAAG